MRFPFLLLFFFSALTSEISILALSGSTRKDSMNKKLAAEAASIAKNSGAIVTLIDLKDFPTPLYDEDLEVNKGIPKNAQQLIKLIREHNGIIIASPSYNGSISAVLKNAIDWASRTPAIEGKSLFANKPFAIMSASPGPYGGSRGLKHLADIITTLKGKVVETKVSVGNAYQAFDKNDKLKNSQLRLELKKEVEELINMSL